MLIRLICSAIVTIPIVFCLLGSGMVFELLGTWFGISWLAGTNAIFLLLAYCISGDLQRYSRHRIARTESEELQNSRHRFAGTGIAHDPFEDDDSSPAFIDDSGSAFNDYSSPAFNDDSGPAFNDDWAPAFNIDGAAMMGDFDTNGHVYGQTD